MVDKPLRGGDWTGVLSSNDACGLSHSHPKWWPDSASDRPSRLIWIWLYLNVASHVSFT